jgi:hypothetical protein
MAARRPAWRSRKLTVIMHAMWRDGSEFRFKATPAEGAAKGCPTKLIAVTA